MKTEVVTEKIVIGPRKKALLEAQKKGAKNDRAVRNGKKRDRRPDAKVRDSADAGSGDMAE